MLRRTGTQTRSPTIKPHVRFAQALLLLLAARPALAEAAYPVSARLTLAPSGEQRCLKVAGAEGSDCTVVEQVHLAFSAAVARMFTSGASANLELALTVTDADLFENVLGGTQLTVRTRVRVVAPDGKVLDEITSGGSAPVFAQTASQGAAAVAAEEAARAFEVSYARSAAVRDWLVRNKIAPPASVSIPGRGKTLVFFAAGAGLVQGGGDGDVVFSPSLRVGASSGRFVLQAMYSTFTSSFQAVAPNSLGSVLFSANLHINDFGVEVGASFRISPALELRIGPGIHLLFGSGGVDADGGRQTSESSSKLSPSIFASLSTTFLPFRSGARFFAGLEARAYLFSTVDMGDFGRTMPAANTSLVLVLGAELPWTPSQGRTR